MNEQILDDVFAQASKEKWIYPQVFDALKEAGVERYEVDVRHHEIKYVGRDSTVTKKAPDGFSPLNVGTFSEAAFKTALMRSQKQESTYPQFLAEIAAAGIVFYRVDMKLRRVTYHGADKRQKIVEPIPPTSERSPKA